MRIEVARVVGTPQQQNAPATASQWGDVIDILFQWDTVPLTHIPESIGGAIDEVMAVSTLDGEVVVRSTWRGREWTQYVHPRWGALPYLSVDDGDVVHEDWPTLEELGGPWVAAHILPDGHAIPLCYVPPVIGFQMGDGMTQLADRRSVDVPGGFVALTPTTVEQWAWYCAHQGKKVPNVSPDVRHHPVASVNFWDALEFSQWAGLGLPTEEQWEHAARGGDGRIYPWGDDEPGDYPDPRCHWSGGLGGGPGGVSPVFERPAGASPYGCLDMSGNVWEWCDSLYYRERAGE